ncbi:MAG: Holliday junction resolvase RuvX [Bacteroidales bacterium]|nr:Holliday junction resolvase RuvX [Bacteroidales bacterium]MBO7321088.1 Holliday junction resolvase RuvX [Bacteroidales bacterium]MBQ2243029.1 Holliday junction resolvase RuvX [Bacteroidales bacterium]
MKRLVGIDYGKKRVGVAVSDPLMIFASPLETVPTANIINYLKTYTSKEEVEKFVVGYPVNMDNRPSEAAQYVDIFLKQLRKAFPQIPVELEDERFTSVLAFQSLIDSGVKKMDRRDKSAVDKVSAALILQTYMDRKK